jgi:hypothetical protein
MYPRALAWHGVLSLHGGEKAERRELFEFVSFFNNTLSGSSNFEQFVGVEADA